MRFAVTTSLAALALLGAVGAAGAQTVAKAGPDPASFLPTAGSYSLSYDADLLGTPVVKLGVELGIRPGAYDMTAQISTIGFADWLLGWKQQISSQGRISTSTVLPDQHRNVSEFRGRARKAEIDYVEGKVATLRVDPPPSDDGHDDFNEKQRAGTRDPMSAILGLLYAANQGQACSGRTAVFDGRRRYDLVINGLPAGKGDAAASTPAGKAALACSVQFVRIAGERSGADKGKPKREESGDTARVWMAPVASLNVMAPVRIEFDSSLGTMTLVLREANFTLAGAEAPRRAATAAR